jgi:hypothetical protein
MILKREECFIVWSVDQSAYYAGTMDSNPQWTKDQPAVFHGRGSADTLARILPGNVTVHSAMLTVTIDLVQ